MLARATRGARTSTSVPHCPTVPLAAVTACFVRQLFRVPSGV